MHRSFSAFLHNREILENGGVFVTRASFPGAQRKHHSSWLRLFKMNPALSGGAVTGGLAGSGMGHGMRDRLVVVVVAVVKLRGCE